MTVQCELTMKAGCQVAIDHLLCVCEHRKYQHYQGDLKCDGNGDTCNCKEFRVDLSIDRKWREDDAPNKGDFCVTIPEEMKPATELVEGKRREAAPSSDDISRPKKESGLKDSGQRLNFASGMVRDVDDEKPAFDLVIPKGIPYDKLMLTRWAELLRKGAIKYARRNWEKADSDEELERAQASAFRHFMQWLSGETDEDHAAAVFFNINEVETIKYKQAIKRMEQNGS
jgi:dATP/dGTP diphosphohydrolase